MTLVDNENGKPIVNPYVTLYSPDMERWAALNSSTFGIDVQHQLINIFEEGLIRELGKRNKKLYKAVATVAKQNYPLEYEKRNLLRTVRTEGADDAVALIPLGYLLEDVVKAHFPETYKFFEKRD